MKKSFMKGLIAASCMTAVTVSSCSVFAKDIYNDDIKIGFISNDLSASITSAWIDGMEGALVGFNNIAFQAFDGEGSADTEIRIMDDLINQEYDAVIIQCTDGASLAASVYKAEGAGIPVVTLNLDAETEHSSLVAMVDYEGGKLIAREMAEAMGGEGQVAIISATPGATKGENIDRGFREVMGNEYPGIEIVDEQTGEWLAENAYTVMNDFLTKFPDLKGVLCHNDAMAEGASEAAKAVGRLDGLQIWGLDGESKMLEYIEQGMTTGTVFSDCGDQGATCVRMALYHIQTGVQELEETPVIKINPILVTADNVADITEDMRW